MDVKADVKELPVKLRAGLTHKLGPLPVWAWGAVIVGGVLAYRFMKGKGTTASTTAAALPATLLPGSASVAAGSPTPITASNPGSVGASTAPALPGVAYLGPPVAAPITSPQTLAPSMSGVSAGSPPSGAGNPNGQAPGSGVTSAAADWFNHLTGADQAMVSASQPAGSGWAQYLNLASMFSHSGINLGGGPSYPGQLPTGVGRSGQPTYDAGYNTVNAFGNQLNAAGNTSAGGVATAIAQLPGEQSQALTQGVPIQ